MGLTTTFPRTTGALGVLAAGLLLAVTPATQADNGPVVITEGLDLPIAKPVYDPNAAANNGSDPADPQAPGPDVDDPSDDPPPVFFGEEIDAESDTIIYVVDRSCSMYWDAEPFIDNSGMTRDEPSRMDRARDELARSISSLPERFSFNVVFFSTCVERWSESAEKATAENKADALEYIFSVRPSGQTNTSLGVAAALQDRQANSLVLLSDGAPTYLDCSATLHGSKEEHRDVISYANVQGATINTFGMKLDESRGAREFMLGVALDNGGTFTEVD